MSNERCAEMRFLLQADADGELEASGAALVAAHLANCPDCAAEQAGIAALSTRLRTELPSHSAPARLRAAVMAAVAAPDATAGTTTEVAPTRRSRPRKFWSGGVRRWWRAIQPFGAGVAVTAALAIALSPPHAEKDPAESVVASHIRALQPGHLMDVASTDQHTVKPWFDGRLDYAPPVKDLATDGFPLIGGRLDYLDGRPVAALAYRHAQHIIDFYVWPRSGRSAADGGSGGVNGYNYVRWSTNDMTFWAVSDVNPADLDTFIADWRAAP